MIPTGPMVPQFPENVFYCDFSPDFKNSLNFTIKSCGVKMVEQTLNEIGFRPVVSKAIIKFMMRNYGW